MSDSKIHQNLARTFTLMSQGTARKKIYARKADKEGRTDVAVLLRAMAASENVQARRLFNSLIGRVDLSDEFLATIFEKEVQDILDNYSGLLDEIPAERTALRHTVAQLRAAETRLLAFYSWERRDVKTDKDTIYFVCRFCGYLCKENPPQKCPICTASKDAFTRIE